jgi:hypothetical protein
MLIEQLLKLHSAGPPVSRVTEQDRSSFPKLRH